MNIVESWSKARGKYSLSHLARITNCTIATCFYIPLIILSIQYKTTIASITCANTREEARMNALESSDLTESRVTQRSSEHVNKQCRVSGVTSRSVGAI